MQTRTRNTRFAPVLVSLLMTLAPLATSCGNVTLPMASTESKEEPGSEESKGNGSAGSKDGVRLGLALPEDFKSDADDADVAAEDSDMAEQLEAALGDQGITVSCDDDVPLTWELAKEKNLLGIFELTVTNWAGGSDESDDDQPYYDKEPMPWDEETSDDEGGLSSVEGSEEGGGLMKEIGRLALQDDGEEGKEVDGECREKDEDEDEDRDDWKDEDDYYHHNEGAYAGLTITHLAIPFVCAGNATIQLTNLDASGKYTIDGALYTAEGRLSYVGASEAFSPADTTTVELAMSKVAEGNGNVDVRVVFNDDQGDGGVKPDETEDPPFDATK